MSVRAIVAAFAVVAIPFAVQGAEPQRKQEPSQLKRICTAELETGSRVSSIRRCETRAERDTRRRESRYAVERAQANRGTTGQ